MNLHTFPGVVDQEREVDALLRAVASTQIDQVQVRSLAIDTSQVPGGGQEAQCRRDARWGWRSCCVA